MKTLFQKWIDTSEIIFPDYPTEQASINHCISECIEIVKEPHTGRKAVEYADAIMCLLVGMKSAGISLDYFEEMFRYKMEKNANRTWKKNADGSFNHVKETL